MSLPSAPTRQLLADFDALHRHYLQFPAVISPGKDAKILAALWRSHPAYVSTLMPYFFAERDGFVERGNGYTVGMYQHKFAGLLYRYGRQVLLAETTTNDWREECARTCGGRCGSSLTHALLKPA